MGRTSFKHLALLLIAAFLALTVPDLQAKPPEPVWFPLQSSNEWVLAGTNLDAHTILCTAAPRGTFLVSGLFDQSVVLRGAAGVNLQASATGRSPWATAFRFGRAADRPWRFDLAGGHCEDFRASWAADTSVLVTPAGTFSGCRHWQCQRATIATNECTGPITTDLWFAPGVGPVAMQLSDGQQLLLTAATVGAQTYPAPTNGLAAVLIADQSVYTNISAHILYCPACVTNNPACEIACVVTGGVTATANFDFRVTNVSTNPQTLFLAGLQFDIQLIDTNGVVVADWSAGKAIPQIVAPLLLAPGESHDFDAAMLLEDQASNQLSGVYLARAFLTTAGPPSDIDATTSIQVIRLLTP